MMKTKALALIFTLAIYSIASCQTSNKTVSNKKHVENIYGKPNKNALAEIKDFEKLIGVCNCKSVQYRAGKPGDTLDLKWKWKYILDGYGIQDEGWYGNDTTQNHFTSIRILNPKTKKWHVPFFTPNMTSNPNIWTGGKEGDKIILKRTQKTKKGEFESILTFSSITDKGFNWEGKIFNPSLNKTNVFWKIWCIKEE